VSLSPSGRDLFACRWRAGACPVGHNRTRPPPCMRWRGPCSTCRSRLAGLPGSADSGGPTAGASHPLPVPVSRLLPRPESFPSGGARFRRGCISTPQSSRRASARGEQLRFFSLSTESPWLSTHPRGYPPPCSQHIHRSSPSAASAGLAAPNADPGRTIPPPRAGQPPAEPRRDQGQPSIGSPAASPTATAATTRNGHCAALPQDTGQDLAGDLPGRLRSDLPRPRKPGLAETGQGAQRPPPRGMTNSSGVSQARSQAMSCATVFAISCWAG
jgi:hypothetical protein